MGEMVFGSFDFPDVSLYTKQYGGKNTNFGPCSMPQLAPLIYLSLGGQFEADGKGSICPIIPSIKLCASIKVCALLTVKCFKIATFGQLQTVSGNYLIVSLIASGNINKKGRHLSQYRA